MADETCKWVALLRGVNVGGANKVAMADLRGLAEGLGWTNVQTYIASGNLVFETFASADPLVLATQLNAGMIKGMGGDVPVLVLQGSDVTRALDACLWDVKGNLVHVFFCWGLPQIDTALRDDVIAPDEELVVQGSRVWLFAPSGVGRSKLMAKIEKVLGVDATARNFNTVRKLAAMVSP